MKTIERLLASWPPLLVVAVIMIDEDGVDTFARAGACAVKVGVGAGSICTTHVVAGAGMPQLSVIWYISRRAQQLGVPIIADGGVTYSGDVAKALAVGASTVMLGSLLVGADEIPGDLKLFEGRGYKSCCGMGSLGAMQGLGADRYGSAQGSGAGGSASGGSGGRSKKLVPEGIESCVADAEPLPDVTYQLVGGLCSGMGYLGRGY